MELFYGAHNFVFSLFPVLFLAVFGITLATILSQLFRGASQHRKDSQSPQLTVETTVVTKRTHVWGDHSHTDYYVTFQVESGDRMELKIPHDQFGYLVEGDRGKLTFQGTRFLDFQRII